MSDVAKRESSRNRRKSLLATVLAPPPISILRSEAFVLYSLCCSAFITVMQTAELRDGDDSSDTRDLAR